MIPREGKWLLLGALALILTEQVKCQTGKAYDTSEWIPITPSSPHPSASEVVEAKVASDRVLSLDVPAQRFFPNDDYEYRKRRPNQVQQFADNPRPRKLKHPSEYKFETPPPPPSKNQPQINYYNTESVAPYLFGQQPVNYYAKQPPKQKPLVDGYVAVPSVNPQAPAPNAPNLYEQYQLPFNASFYQSLNPSSINNDFYQAVGNGSQQQQLPKTEVEQESVQLVYVPVENLKPQQPPPPQDLYQQQVDAPKQHKIPLPPINSPAPTVSYKPLEQPRQEKLVYNVQTPQFLTPYNTPKQQPVISKQARLESIQQDFVQQALQAHKLQQQFRDDINPLNHEVITTKPKSKPKPHQPPLAVFLESQSKAEITDVLRLLKGAKTISVQDKVTASSPQIFIGPSNLDSPDGYTKFPLPYLNNINGNRIERKIDQLPFFVAPVSYKTPPGYAKISLPSPHVGSVVVSVPTAPPTPPPVLINQNQFAYSAPGYSPQEDNIKNYNIIDQYQSTPPPQYTDSPLLPPVRDIFDNVFAPRQPDNYYTQPNVNQPTYQEEIPTLDVYRPQTPSTEKPKEHIQLPDINPLEVAINEFELHQINDEFEEHNKVKHSTTTRRPEIVHEENHSRSPPARGRHTYDNEAATERPRGRTRGRARGSTSRTTTTTTTTYSPVEVDRYTVLEEFNAKAPSTEVYEAETEPPKRTTTQFSANPYLPGNVYENPNPQYEIPKRKPIEAEPPPPPQTIKPLEVGNTEIEQTPANVYSLGPPQTYEFERTQTNEPRREVTPTERPKIEVAPTHVHRFSPELVSYENREPNQHREQPNYQLFEVADKKPEPKQPVFQPETNEGEQILHQQQQLPNQFLDNLYRPNFDQTYISLQDQAVRSLLVPNILAPTTARHDPEPVLVDVTTEQRVLSEIPVEVAVTTQAPVETTTTARSRTRGRARARLSTTSSSVSRKTSNIRRRPTTKTSTERTEYSTRSGANTGQRFRTRGRPVQNEIIDRISTTENDLKTFQENEQSQQQYAPFEQVIEEQPIKISQEPKQYHQVYSLPPQTSTEDEQVVLQYENTKLPVENEQIVYTNNANIKSGGVLMNNKPDKTTKAPSTNARGRTRGRSRFATTPRPAARVTSTLRTTTQSDEIYGFTRQPAYTPPNLNIQAENFEEPSIQFEEIRPKYSPRTTTPQRIEDLDAVETPRPRVRSRTRAPATRKTNYRQSENEVHTAKGSEQVTRRSGATTRTRGRGHYRVPENVKRQSDNEDVANQNYPANFLQKLDSSRPNKIHEEIDQSAYSSIYRPKYVSKPYDYVDPNALSFNDKPEVATSEPPVTVITEEPTALAFIQTTQNQLDEFTEMELDQATELEKFETAATEQLPTTDIITKKQGKRRGVWKLIKQRPVDPLEGSESQNYQSVINMFDTIDKVTPYHKEVGFTEAINTEAAAEVITTTPSATKTQENIFDTIYEMFGIFNKGKETSLEETTTSAVPTFPEEITEVFSTTTNETNLESTETTLPPTTTEIKPYQVEPWQMKVVKTSTSTEVSHETEICYKGRCIKSREKKQK